MTRQKFSIRQSDQVMARNIDQNIIVQGESLRCEHSGDLNNSENDSIEMYSVHL